MATINGPASMDVAPADFRLTADKYTTVDQLINTTKDLVIPELVETYGDQGITGFLRLTGAISSGGSADQVDWWEVGRRHKTASINCGTGTGETITGAVAADGDPGDDPATSKFFQTNDVLMNTVTGARLLVVDDLRTGDTDGVTLARLDGVAIANDGVTYTASTAETYIVLGNIYAQGTNQPEHFLDTDVVRQKNPFMIVKDRFQVNGSQATNIGWVNVGGGEYRWFMYGEQEARKRFEDRREMMMLFGEQNAETSTGILKDLPGSDGYFTQVDARGIKVTNANANPLDSFAEFDDIIIELDKQGAPSEYAMYLNRKQDLAIDDMLASGIATSVTAGLPGQFGAFQNSADMAVQLGFKSFTRGGYTFHKHDWKLLNDPNLLGASTKFQGAMLPLTQVADARTGMKAPSLAMYYKEANGYSREMEHWVTGGGVLGHTNNGDTGADVATFHYRSEVALCVRAANQHVILKG
jgi:hypothetical protein